MVASVACPLKRQGAIHLMPDRVVVVGSESLDFPGGMERVCRELVNRLKDEGFEVSYVGASQLLHPSFLDKIPSRRWNMRGFWRPVEAAIAVARRVMRDPPDIAVTHGPLGWGIRGKRLSIHYYHGTYVGYAEALRDVLNPLGWRLLRWRDGMLLERMAGHGKICVACSENVRREVKQYFGYDSQVVWNPVNVHYFTPGPKDMALLEDLGLERDRPIGLFVGAGRPMKGELTAYEVIRRLPEAQWLIIGEPRFVPPELRDRVRRPIPPQEMPRLLRTVDLLLASSWYDPFLLLIPEALASGTPVVASGASGSASFLLSEPPLDQWIVPDPRDVESYVRKVRHILKDPETARVIAMKGRTRVVKELAPEAWWKRFLEATGLR